MTGTKLAHLSDRGVVSVTGDDAGKFLQGLLTNDMVLLGAASAMHAGLLTPQGKILFDFFVIRTADGYLLETASDKAAELAKRLAMYKLRAAVAISDVSADYSVLAVWGGAPPALVAKGRSVSFADPRLPELGVRVLAEAGFADAIASSAGAKPSSAEDYHAYRIGLGVPEGGKDYPFGDAFPHEALFDQLRSVSFTKGCYVGQEVVSRMEHRGTARKRTVPIAGESELPAPGAEIKAGEVTIGTLGSVAGDRGLALLRLDRAAEAMAKGVPLLAGAVPIKIVIPPFATFKLEPQPASA